MKRIFIISVIWLFALQAIAQQKTTISGKLLNCTDRMLELSPSTGSFRDSIMVNPDGTFNYATTKIKGPFRANLTNRKQIQIQLFIAPGYNLQITADVKDAQTVRSSLVYEGLGSKTNSYWKPINLNYHPDTVKWYLKDEDTYLAHLKKPSNNANLEQVFGPLNNEPCKEYFKSGLLLDRKFGGLISIIDNYAYYHKYNPEQTTKMIEKFGFNQLENELNQKNNLSSLVFCYLVGDVYPYFAKQRDRAADYKLDPSISNYSLFKISNLYQGSVYDYVMEAYIHNSINFVYKLTDLEKYKPYIVKVKDNDTRKSLINLYENKVKNNVFLRIGKPAPEFDLPDTSGVKHSLASFKGKVVYIDLWASWCGPCREENPYMQKLYERYRANPKISVVSIAVNDLKTRKYRYQILKETKPDWMQLEDENDVVLKNYTANSIPRFIIIDKAGNIVDPDAPRPSQIDKLIAILNREINK